MPTVTLVTGGVRSGKSRHALERAAAYRRKAFIATAQPMDEEMRARIETHRHERGASFVTIEEPIDLAAALRRIPAGCEVAVIDCLTVWLGNLMHARGAGAGYPELDAFVEALRSPPCDLIVVTNEVGMGIVPGTELGRAFRDLAGQVNQRVAGLSGRVVLLVSGIPVKVKEGART